MKINYAEGQIWFVRNSLFARNSGLADSLGSRRVFTRFSLAAICDLKKP